MLKERGRWEHASSSPGWGGGQSEASVSSVNVSKAKERPRQGFIETKIDLIVGDY